MNAFIAPSPEDILKLSDENLLRIYGDMRDAYSEGPVENYAERMKIIRDEILRRMRKGKP